MGLYEYAHILVNKVNEGSGYVQPLVLFFLQHSQKEVTVGFAANPDSG